MPIQGFLFVIPVTLKREKLQPEFSIFYCYTGLTPVFTGVTVYSTCISVAGVHHKVPFF
jgi:hypothetical protein